MVTHPSYLIQTENNVEFKVIKIYIQLYAKNTPVKKVNSCAKNEPWKKKKTFLKNFIFFVDKLNMIDFNIFNILKLIFTCEYCAISITE